MSEQTANTVVFKKNGTTYQVVSSTDEEAIKKILDIEDEISTLESNISTVTEALTTAQSKAVNKIVFCSEVPSDSIGSVNTLYLTRTMGGGVTEATYTNTIEEVKGLTFTLSPLNPKAGDIVTLTVSINDPENYSLNYSELTILYNGGSVLYTNIPPESDEITFACQFMQPAANCYISGFECIENSTSPGPDIP